MILVILAASLLMVLLAVAGVNDLLTVSASRRRAIEHAELDHGTGGTSALRALDGRLRPTALGRRLERELELAGVSQSPVLVLAVATGITAVATYALWHFLAPALAVLGLAVGYLALRWYLERERVRRREAFVAQLPELARLLANASYAGLSLPTALAMAAGEIGEPARTELTRVATRMRFGASLDRSLDELRERVGSRETSVLISTLVVAARSGGSLVTALRGIADTLDQRKETRREIQTTLAQAVATSYIVVLMGLGMLLLLNVLRPGTVRMMTEQTVGQVALGIAAALFTGGFVAIRRMTRIEP